MKEGNEGRVEEGDEGRVEEMASFRSIARWLIRGDPHALISELLLGDFLSVFLPVMVLAFIQVLSGGLGVGFLVIPEWAFCSVVMATLALTRSLELKIQHQRDWSARPLALVRGTVVLTLFSVILFIVSYSRDETPGDGLGSSALLAFFQFILLGFGALSLILAHLAREAWLADSKDPSGELADAHFYSHCIDGLRNSNESLRRLLPAIRKGPKVIDMEASNSEAVLGTHRAMDFYLKEIRSALEETEAAWSAWPLNRSVQIANGTDGSC